MAVIPLDKMKIKSLVNSVFNSNTFVLTSEKGEDCWLVDIGDIEPVLSLLNSRVVRGVFITHSHYDHIYGLPALLERYPNCLIYTSVDGMKGLASDKLNFSRYHDDPIKYEGNNIRILEDGDSVELFEGVFIRAMLTPGHDKSCVTYYTDSCVFTGDSYIPNLKVVTSFPHSNKHDSEISLKKIHKLLETRKVFPGHQ